MTDIPERVFQTINPPSQDTAWVQYIISVRQVLEAQKPDRVEPYLQGRLAAVRTRLGRLGWSEAAIAIELVAFEAAVRSQASERQGIGERRKVPEGELSIEFAISNAGIVRITPTSGAEAVFDFWQIFNDTASLKRKAGREARRKRDETFRRHLAIADAKVPEIEVAEQFLQTWLDAAAYELGFIQSAEKEAAWHLDRSRRADRSIGRRAA